MRNALLAPCLALVIFGCQRAGAAQEESAPAAEPAAAAESGAADEPSSTAASTARVREGQACGVCYAHNWQSLGARGYGSQSSEGQLRELDALGVSSFSLTSFAWMRTVRDTSIRTSQSMPGSETFARMRTDAERADALGATVMVKPHIWIGRGEWRGDIDPDPDQGGWDAWFESYRTYLLEHARFAEEIDAEWFVVGVEMVSAARQHPERFRALIAEVRTVYGGQLTYAANWDEAESVVFWDALDALGVQMFAPLSEGATDIETLRAGARAWLERYEALAERFDKPLILTEVGTMNRVGGVRAPYEWPERVEAEANAEGDAEQARYYQAIAETFGQSERVIAMYWWKWFTNPNTDEEGPVGFSPRGKPAESVLRAMCGGAAAPG